MYNIYIYCKSYIMFGETIFSYVHGNGVDDLAYLLS